MRSAESINDEPSNLTKLILVAVALTVLIAIVVACLPAQGQFTQGWRQAWAQMSKGIALPQLASGSHQRPTVSYSNPQVRRTLDLPWARN